MTFDLKYRAGTKYGDMYPNFVLNQHPIPTRHRAELIREGCFSRDDIEIIERTGEQ